MEDSQRGDNGSAVGRSEGLSGAVVDAEVVANKGLDVIGSGRSEAADRTEERVGRRCAEDRILRVHVGRGGVVDTARQDLALARDLDAPTADSGGCACAVGYNKGMHEAQARLGLHLTLLTVGHAFGVASIGADVVVTPVDEPVHGALIFADAFPEHFGVMIHRRVGLL